MMDSFHSCGSREMGAGWRWLFGFCRGSLFAFLFHYGIGSLPTRELVQRHLLPLRLARLILANVPVQPQRPAAESGHSLGMAAFWARWFWARHEKQQKKWRS